MNRWLVGLGVLVLLGPTGCQVPSRPAWWPTDPASAPPAGGPGPGDPGVPVAARPWATGDRQLGVNVYWDEHPPDNDDAVRALSRRTLDYLLGLHVNAVTVNFPLFMDSPWASAVRTDPAHTPDPARLAIFVEEARRSRLRVAIRPVLDERRLVEADANAWRGTIAPADRAAWFAAYQRLLLPYATMAQRGGVAELVVGVELNSLQADPRWAATVAAVRGEFRGEVSYSQNFDAYQHGAAVPAVDSVGVDTYFSVTAGDDAPVDALAAAWSGWLAEHVGDPGRTVLHEVGIAAQDGAYRHPPQWGDPGVALNLEVQRRWYEAVCRAAREAGLAGLYFWSVRLHAVPGREGAGQADRMAFMDRPAETTLRDCYATFPA